MIPEGYRIRELTAVGRPGAGGGLPAQPGAPRALGADAATRASSPRRARSAAVAGQLASVGQGLVAAWVLTHGEQVVGRVNLNNIVMGVLRSASVGYWVDAEHLGRGLAAGAVEFACAQAQGRGLHRVEAGTLLHNTASQRVLERCGFELYGIAPTLPVHRRRVAGPPALPADPARQPALTRRRGDTAVAPCGARRRAALRHTATEDRPRRTRRRPRRVTPHDVPQEPGHDVWCSARVGGNGIDLSQLDRVPETPGLAAAARRASTRSRGSASCASREPVAKLTSFLGHERLGRHRRRRGARRCWPTPPATATTSGRSWAGAARPPTATSAASASPTRPTTPGCAGC